MVLVTFPDSPDFGRCLKSKSENPERNAVAVNQSELVTLGLKDQTVA